MSETLEQISKRIARDFTSRGLIDADDLPEIVRQVVAALGAQEPVSECVDDNEGGVYYRTLSNKAPIGNLYAAPVVKEGWQMVPKEHVCGLQGFGALDDVCPACESAAPEYGHPSCNRTTNYPCKWSGTPVMETTCRVCGKDFPEWN